jgi:hypothetical protein
MIDTSAGGTYLEAAVSSVSVSDYQLTVYITTSLRQQDLGAKTALWPQYINELEKEEKVSELILYVFQSRVGGHFEFFAPRELAVTSQGGIGTHFLLKCMR